VRETSQSMTLIFNLTMSRAAGIWWVISKRADLYNPGEVTSSSLVHPAGLGIAHSAAALTRVAKNVKAPAA